MLLSCPHTATSCIPGRVTSSHHTASLELKVLLRVSCDLKLPFPEPLTSPRHRAVWVLEQVALEYDTQNAVRTLRGCCSFGLWVSAHQTSKSSLWGQWNCHTFYLGRSNLVFGRAIVCIWSELDPLCSRGCVPTFGWAQGKESSSLQVVHCYSEEPARLVSVAEGPAWPPRVRCSGRSCPAPCTGEGRAVIAVMGAVLVRKGAYGKVPVQAFRV